MRKIALISSLILLLTNCSLLDQISGAFRFSQCEYTYNSVKDIQLSGINLGDGSSISLSNFASISSILSGGNLQTIPFSMTLNMNVKNPNPTAAFLNGLDYTIEVNELEFTSGKIDTPIRIEPGETEILSIAIGVDLKNLINRYSRNRVAKEMRSFLGLSSDETKVAVKLWPTLTVGNKPMKAPAPIPVVFTFGGKDSL